MPLKPYGLFPTTSEGDLKRSFAKRQWRQIILSVGQIFIDQPVEPVCLPIKFILHRDHASPNAIKICACRSQYFTSGNFFGSYSNRLK